LKAKKEAAIAALLTLSIPCFCYLHIHS